MAFHWEQETGAEYEALRLLPQDRQVQIWNNSLLKLLTSLRFWLIVFFITILNCFVYDSWSFFMLMIVDDPAEWFFFVFWFLYCLAMLALLTKWYLPVLLKPFIRQQLSNLNK
jgi:hypothetical protein